ncbi:hypothetical protein BDW22DRAFT_1361069 [Trametopsis cervina]|nr:hypothetical protein BDW22DRAFT_1361069 [Trametopsis cervina]
MSGNIRTVLEAQHQALEELYTEHLHAVQDLQTVLITDILPGLADELDWDGGTVEFAREWLNDTGSVFRMLKRHKFTTSFTLEALRTMLIWRHDVLQTHLGSASPFLTCLPASTRDPLGRPIVIIRLARLWEHHTDLRGALLHNMELLRLHLVSLSEHDSSARPVLQYVALLDIKGVTFNGVQSLQLLSWFMQDLVPKFPGLLAAAFVLNYSWTQAGLWNLSKRILPASALQKVFFPTALELRAYLSPDALPQEWSGTLPPLQDIDNVLRRYTAGSPPPPTPSLPQPPPQPSSPPPPQPPAQPVLSALSLLNPFFGYPVTSSSSSSESAPYLRHGRRRKRDLVYTLARLWWVRWGGALRASLLVLLALIAVWKRRRLWGLSRRFITSK